MVTGILLIVTKKTQSDINIFRLLCVDSRTCQFRTVHLISWVTTYHSSYPSGRKSPKNINFAYAKWAKYCKLYSYIIMTAYVIVIKKNSWSIFDCMSMANISQHQSVH